MIISGQHQTLCNLFCQYILQHIRHVFLKMDQVCLLKMKYDQKKCMKYIKTVHTRQSEVSRPQFEIREKSPSIPDINTRTIQRAIALFLVTPACF